MAKGDPCQKCGGLSTDKYLRRGLCKKCDATRRLMTGYEVSLVDAEPARQHVIALREAGIGERRIGELAGMSRSVIQSLIRGKSRDGRREPPSAQISKRTHEKIMAVPLPTPAELKLMMAPGARVDATGTRRRIRALIAFGYTQSALAARIGWQVGNFSHQLVHHKGATVTAATAVKVQEMFTELELTPGQADRSRQLAKKHGWVVPMAWDEDEIDVPDVDVAAVKAATAPRPKRYDFVDLYLELRDFIGLNDTQIAARMGIELNSLQQAKARHADELRAMENLEGLAG